MLPVPEEVAKHAASAVRSSMTASLESPGTAALPYEQLATACRGCTTLPHTSCLLWRHRLAIIRLARSLEPPEQCELADAQHSIAALQTGQITRRQGLP